MPRSNVSNIRYNDEYQFKYRYYNIPGMCSVVFLDESGFQLSELSGTKGRSPKGKKPILTIPPQSKRVNAIASLSKEGIPHVKCVTTPYRNAEGVMIRGVNAQDFSDFLLELGPKIPRESFIILDNCKIHHANFLEGEGKAWDKLEKDFGHRKIYLSAYSPL